MPTWPIDGRIDAYLHHHGLGPVANDGATYSALLETVMANIGPALRRAAVYSSLRTHPRSAVESHPPPEVVTDGRDSADKGLLTCDGVIDIVV